MEHKQLIAAGTPNYLAIKPEYTDEQILEHVRAIYQWETVAIIRQDHIVLVQPLAPVNERDNAHAV